MTIEWPTEEPADVADTAPLAGSPLFDEVVAGRVELVAWAVAPDGLGLTWPAVDGEHAPGS